MFNHKLTTHLMPISESQGMLRELLETHRQTDGGGGGGGGGGGRLFEAGHLLTFFTVRMGAYSRRVLTRGWALIRIIR